MVFLSPSSPLTIRHWYYYYLLVYSSIRHLHVLSKHAETTKMIFYHLPPNTCYPASSLNRFLKGSPILQVQIAIKDRPLEETIGKHVQNFNVKLMSLRGLANCKLQKSSIRYQVSNKEHLGLVWELGGIGKGERVLWEIFKALQNHSPFLSSYLPLKLLPF